MREYRLLPTQSDYPEPGSMTSLSDFLCVKTAHISGVSIDNFFDNCGFPTPGITGQENHVAHNPSMSVRHEVKHVKQNTRFLFWSFGIILATKIRANLIATNL